MRGTEPFGPDVSRETLPGERPTSPGERPTSSSERPTSSPERSSSPLERPPSPTEYSSSSGERSSSSGERSSSRTERFSSPAKCTSSLSERTSSFAERSAGAKDRHLRLLFPGASREGRSWRLFRPQSRLGFAYHQKNSHLWVDRETTSIYHPPRFTPRQTASGVLPRLDSLNQYSQ